MKVEITPSIRKFMNPGITAFVNSLAIGLPDSVRVTVSTMPKPLRRQARATVWCPSKRKNQHFRMLIAPDATHPAETWIHEFAHVLDYVTRPGTLHPGAVGHNTGWGQAYSVCFALWAGEVRCVQARVGFVRWIIAHTGEIKEARP